MPDANDEQFLRRAIRLAMNGRGHAEPNPMVGCVLVKNGQVIGEGYHKKFGQPHAEPNALKNCTESAEGATAYVTLEPCSHLDKQTPPCAPRLIEAKIGRVVIGCLDPNPKVNGNGVKILKDAGISVEVGLLEAECKQLIAPFMATTIHKRPYITMKWAQTANGKVGGPNGSLLQISNKTARKVVHELRARCDAIVVGIKTVLADDPMLTSRGVRDARPSVRWVLDRNLSIPLESRLVDTAREFPVIVATSEASIRSDKAIELQKKGVTLLPAADLAAVQAALFAQGAMNVLIEPGPILSQKVFEENRADRLWVIQSQQVLEDPTAPDALPVPAHFIQTGQRELQDNLLTEYLNTKSEVFFAAEPSADFVLTSP